MGIWPAALFGDGVIILKTTLIVAGVIWQAEAVLLVQQQGPSDPAPSYALPGGVVEPGELLTDALIREVREETGLEVSGLGPLLYLLQMVNPQADSQTLAYVFTVNEWRGTLGSDDPDGFILTTCFYPVVEAIELLEGHQPWPQMREPLVAHLRGEANSGAVWLYQARPGDDCELVTRLD
jgi:8-oxo-dGTP diphosphatase